MWRYHNPVEIGFGAGALARLPGLLAGRSYALVTYGEPVFTALAERLAGLAGAPAVVVDNITPNPDFAELPRSCAGFAGAPAPPQVIVALGDRRGQGAGGRRRRLCPRTALPGDRHRRRGPARRSHHRRADHRGNRQRGDLLGGRLGRRERQEALAGAPEPLSRARAGRSRAASRPAPGPHHQHRAGRAVARPGEPVEHQRQPGVARARHRRRARTAERFAAGDGGPGQHRIAHEGGARGAHGRARLLQHQDRARARPVLSDHARPRRAPRHRLLVQPAHGDARGRRGRRRLRCGAANDLRPGPRGRRRAPG